MTVAFPASFGFIPSGIAGVRATLKQMVKTTRGFLKPVGGNQAKVQALLSVRLLATNLTLNCAEKDYWAECSALQVFVRDSIRYVADMAQSETLQEPHYTLYSKSGDCDDKAILFCCLAQCIGYPARFCALGVPTEDDPQGECFSHVCGQVLIEGRGWVNAECIPIDDEGTKVDLGWFPPDVTCMMFAHIR
jgi:hypothetical protein